MCIQVIVLFGNVRFSIFTGFKMRQE